MRFIERIKKAVYDVVITLFTLLSIIPYVVVLVVVGMIYIAALMAGPLFITWLIIKLLELYFVISIYVGVAIFLVIFGLAMAVLIRIF